MQFCYYDIKGKAHSNGHIIVMSAVTKNIIAVFKQLYKEKFPIHFVQPSSVYAGDDDKVLEANDTSSYNCRTITGSGAVSIHAYGLAVDLNPRQNPYIEFSKGHSGHAKIKPAAGSQYVNRLNQRPGMVESVVDLFKKNGFTIWGGRWNTPIDYQHFQTTRFVAKMLVALPQKEAKMFFQLTTLYPDQINLIPTSAFKQQIKSYQSKSLTQFMRGFKWKLKTLKVKAT